MNDGTTQPIFIAMPKAGELTADWRDAPEEGQLAVDVAEDDKEIVVVTTMAGADAARIEVSIHHDLLTIRGVRQSPVQNDASATWHCRECFWGRFSRTIVLPAHVNGDLARAEYKGGVLTIKIPKRNASGAVPIVVVDE